MTDPIITLADLQRIRHVIKVAPVVEAAGLNPVTIDHRIRRGSPELTNHEAFVILCELINHGVNLDVLAGSLDTVAKVCLRTLSAYIRCALGRAIQPERFTVDVAMYDRLNDVIAALPSLGLTLTHPPCQRVSTIRFMEDQVDHKHYHVELRVKGQLSLESVMICIHPRDSSDEPSLNLAIVPYGLPRPYVSTTCQN